MTQKSMHFRSGLTAIAAVLALSSTPLIAQETTEPADPVTETPTPAPATDPLAAEPAASEPAAAEATPAAKTTRTTTTRKASTTSKTAATKPAARQPVRAATPASAPAATAPATEANAAPPPVPVAEAAVPVGDVPVDPAAEPAPVTSNLMADETLPIAGAAGLGLLALGGIGMALSRRRRRREELAHHRAAEAFLDRHEAEATPEPAFVRPSQPAVAAMAASAPEAEVLEDAPRTDLPSGFDLSRFGPHVRAAYLGPTPDNPSLSLKYRLRRAGAMDKRAQMEAEKRPMAPAPAPRQPVRQPAWASNNGEGFMLRRAGSDKAERPVTQH